MTKLNKQQKLIAAELLEAGVSSLLTTGGVQEFAKENGVELTAGQALDVVLYVREKQTN